MNLLKHVTPLVMAKVSIVNCRFSHLKSRTPGGAISIHADKMSSYPDVHVFVTILDSVFINNVALDEGGALFLSGDVVTTIYTCLFFFNLSRYVSSKGTFIYTEDMPSIVKSRFIVSNHESHGSFIYKARKEPTLSGYSQVVNLIKKCPDWFKSTWQI